jgi:hypothetical protein
VPELCVGIFEQLDTPSLYSVVRVCRTWANLGLSVLWRAITAAALRSLPSFGGFDYGALVRQLKIDRDNELHEAAYDVMPFPQLVQLDIAAGFVDANPEQALDLLERCGATLKSVEISCRPRLDEDGDDDPVADDIWDYDPVDASLFAELAGRSALTNLRVDLRIEAAPTTGHRLGAGGRAALRNVRRFAAAVDTAVLPAFIVALKASLSQLELRVFANPAGVLPAVAQLHQLRELSVTYDDADVDLGAADMLALRTLPRLQRLVLRNIDFMLLEAPDFTDCELELLVASLPDLREWNVESELALSPSGFMLIGRHCRKLRRLMLYGKVDLGALPPVTEPPLFPELALLKLENADEPGPADK